MPHLKCNVGEYAVVINTQKQILLVQLPADSHHPLHWMLPGGRLEEHDSAGNGVIRELKEEANLDIKVIAPCHVARWGSEEPIKYTVFFLCTCSRPEQLRLNNEHSEFKWLSLDTIDSVQWLNQHFPEAIRKAMKLVDLHILDSSR